MPHSHDHFKGKDAISHVAETQVEGKIASTEVHGIEIPGHVSSGADAARETAVIFLLFSIILVTLNHSQTNIILMLGMFSLGWMAWKCGRSAWLGWSRLERLHRLLEQEKWEIEHHRPQEREELRVLYSAKGFEGKLLEDVVDVLMADGDRLLRVMIEEEMGLSLSDQEHPLKQGLGAAIGTFLAAAICLVSIRIYPAYGIIFGSLFTIGIAASVSAHYQQNRFIPAIVWNISLTLVSTGLVFFLIEYFFQKG